MAVKIPKIQHNLPRGGTLSSQRRHMARMAQDIDSVFSQLVDQLPTTPVGAHITKVVQSSQTLSSDPAAAITWASSIFDIDGMWASSPHPTRLTAATKGIYEVTGHADWTVSGTGTVVMTLYVNGSPLANDGARSVPVSLAGQSQTEVWGVALNAGDYVEVFVTRPAGATTSLAASCVADLAGTN